MVLRGVIYQAVEEPARGGHRSRGRLLDLASAQSDGASVIASPPAPPVGQLSARRREIQHSGCADPHQAPGVNAGSRGLAAERLLVTAVSSRRAAPAPTSTPAGAVSYEVGEGWVSSYYDESTQTRWWSYGENPGRSYCVEAVQGSVSPIPLDPNVAVYSDAAGTVPLVVNSVTIANNNGGNDPDFLEGARACYIAPGSASVIRTLKVNVPVGAGSGDSGYIKLRVVDTTLQVPYWEAEYDATNGGFLPRPTQAERI